MGLFLHVKHKCFHQSKKISIEYNTRNSKIEVSTPAVEGNKTETTADDQRFCSKCGEMCMQDNHVNEQCEGIKLFQCCNCSFKSCHKSNLEDHLKTHQRFLEYSVAHSHVRDAEKSTEDLKDNGQHILLDGKKLELSL